jgi:hypothetical protein
MSPNKKNDFNFSYDAMRAQELMMSKYVGEEGNLVDGNEIEGLKLVIRSYDRLIKRK